MTDKQNQSCWGEPQQDWFLAFIISELWLDDEK